MNEGKGRRGERGIEECGWREIVTFQRSRTHTYRLSFFLFSLSLSLSLREFHLLFLSSMCPLELLKIGAILLREGVLQFLFPTIGGVVIKIYNYGTVLRVGHKWATSHRMSSGEISFESTLFQFVGKRLVGTMKTFSTISSSTRLMTPGYWLTHEFFIAFSGNHGVATATNTESIDYWRQDWHFPWKMECWN